MNNRFIETNEIIKQVTRKNGPTGYTLGQTGALSSSYSVWARPFAAADRALVILIENGGVDLGIPDLVAALLSELPGASMLPDSYRQQLVDYIREKLRSFTDRLLESLELSLNRYSSARPDFFGAVAILRDGTASYTDLKNKLIEFSRQGKIIDLIILTHGSGDYISVAGGVNGQKIRAMKTEYGKPLSIRSVYMMNCIGSSLNQAWLDAGAKVSAGSLRNNYLPEPTMFFFWKNWKEGQNFESAVTSAYRKTIALMNDALRVFLNGLPVIGASLVADQFDFENMEFVKDSAPVIQGQRSVTINTDNLTFAQTVSSSLATTVLPVSMLRSFSFSQPDAGAPAAPRSLSSQGVELIKSWEGFRPTAYNDAAGHCTIGYGSLLHSGNCDGRESERPYAGGITAEQAAQILAHEAGNTARTINDQVKVALNQNQFDALVSFVYNIGPGAFSSSTLLKRLNQGDYAAVPVELKKWTKARQNGKLVDLPGLVRRRNGEAELFQKPDGAGSAASGQQSLMLSRSYRYHSPSLFTAQSTYAYQQNPGILIAGVEVADAIQIGLGAAAIVQTQVNAAQGSFGLVYDTAQRMLTAEARVSMPGAQSTKQAYSRRLFWLASGRWNTAKADVIMEWEGNPYGEIGTPVIRKNLPTSTDWSKSSANIIIKKIDRIPLPNTDPRSWPITYTYEGSYDPLGNGLYEFSGEFEVNAFGGLKFNRHEVVSRSLADWAIAGNPEDYVQKGEDAIVPVPAIPQEQINYLKTRLP